MELATVATLEAQVQPEFGQTNKTELDRNTMFVVCITNNYFNI